MQKKQMRGMLLFPLMIILLVGLLISCDDFFTTSWGSWAARDMSKMNFKVSADNIDDLKDMAAGDSAMQLSLLEDLVKAAKNAPPEEKQKLQDAGIELAIESSNIMGAVTNSVDKISELLEGDTEEMDHDEMVSFITDIIGSMDNLQASTDAVTALLPNPDDENYDAALEAFVTNGDATNNVLVSVLLVIAEAEAITADPELNPNGKTVEELFDAMMSDEDADDELQELLDRVKESPKINLAADLADKSSEKLKGTDSPLSALGDVFDEFDLKALLGK